MGDDKSTALLQESLHAATGLGAAKPSDFTRVIVDSTVQPKAIAFPIDAKLMQRARERLVRRAGQHCVALSQSFSRVGKLALIRHQPYAHAKQFKRANRALRTLRTQLGRVIRDIGRKIADKPALQTIFARPLTLLPGVCANSVSASAAARSTACMRRRWNASARARHSDRTNSV